MIPFEKLDAESVFYWSWICEKCKGASPSPKEDGNNKAANHIGDTAEDVNEMDKEKQIESEDHLDRLLPSLTEYCEYLNT